MFSKYYMVLLVVVSGVVHSGDYADKLNKQRHKRNWDNRGRILYNFADNQDDSNVNIGKRSKYTKIVNTVRLSDVKCSRRTNSIGIVDSKSRRLREVYNSVHIENDVDCREAKNLNIGNISNSRNSSTDVYIGGDITAGGR